MAGFIAREERLKKALAASSAPYQELIDSIVYEVVEYKNPLRNNVPRKQGSGDAWHIYRRTASTSACGFVADTGTLTEAAGSYGKTSFTYRTIGTQAQVTRLAQAQGRSYIDLFQQEMESKLREYKDCEDKQMIQATTATTNAWNGLDALIPTTQAVVISSTGAGSLTLAKMDELLDTCAKNPDIIICSKGGRRALNSLLQANQRFVDTVEIKGGAKAIAYNGVPILVSTNIPNTVSFNPVNKTLDAWTGGTSTVIYAVDTDYFFMGVLTEITVEALAKTTSQNDTFDIYADEVPVIGEDNTCAKLLGVLPG